MCSLSASPASNTNSVTVPAGLLISVRLTTAFGGISTSVASSCGVFDRASVFSFMRLPLNRYYGYSAEMVGVTIEYS